MRSMMKTATAIILIITMFAAVMIMADAASESVKVSVGSVSAEVGTETAEIPIIIENNPGILGMVLTLSYDENLKLKGAKEGNAFEKLNLTMPGNFDEKPINFVWDGMDSDNGNGLILTLVVELPQIEGSYTLDFSCQKGGIYDNNMNDLDVEIVNNVITVESNQPKVKTLSITGIKAENKTYDGTTAAIVTGGTLSGVSEGDIVNAVMPTDGTFEKSDVGKGISVNIGEIEIECAKDNAYEYVLLTPELTADITKAPITIKADDITISKGANIPELTYTVTEGKFFGSDKAEGALKTNANSDKIGTYDITVGTLKTTSNYDMTFVNGTLTVADKTPQNITVENTGEKTYGDKKFKLEVTKDAVSGLSEFTFESGNIDVCTIDEEGVITIKGAGEATITVREKGNDEYAPFKSTQTIIVKPKSVSVKNVNVEEKTAELEGVLDGDEVSADLSGVTMELKEVGEDKAVVSVKGIKLTGKKAGSYVLSEDEATAEVTKSEIITVSAEAENGSVSGTGAYIKGSTVTLKATADKNYKFAGWYVGEKKVSSSAAYTFSAEEDVFVTAKFSKKSTGGGGGSTPTYYEVKFNSNGGSSVEIQNVKFGADAVNPETPTKDGYVFKGWFKDAELKNKYNFSTNVYKDITLYAAWEEDTVAKELVLTIGEKEAIAFGKVVTNDVAPIIRNERTMLPARFVAENLGAKVEWVNEERMVRITKDDIEILIFIGSDKAKVNGEEFTLDSEAFIENDRTYTPVRFIAENLGAEVNWDNAAKKVIITK